MHIATPRIDAISLSNVDVFNITASRVHVPPQFYGVAGGINKPADLFAA
jgi:hypothetical protein